MDSRAYDKQLADNVAAAIKRANKSVHGVAVEAGVPPTTLDRRLRSAGDSPMTIRELKRVADVLGVSVASLMPTETPNEADQDAPTAVAS